jgi:hypothetical protein
MKPHEILIHFVVRMQILLMLEHVGHILTIVLQKIKETSAQRSQCPLLKTDTNEGWVGFDFRRDDSPCVNHEEE